MPREMNALERGPSGAPVGWRNPDSGRYGSVVPGPAYVQRRPQLPRLYRDDLYRRPAADRARHRLPQSRRHLDAAELSGANILNEPLTPAGLSTRVIATRIRRRWRASRPSNGCVHYLRELPPQARALLIGEFERSLLRGDEAAGIDLVLQELRRIVRDQREGTPRVGHCARLFFKPLEPFLVDDRADHTSSRPHRALLARNAVDLGAPRRAARRSQGSRRRRERGIACRRRAEGRAFRRARSRTRRLAAIAASLYGERERRQSPPPHAGANRHAARGGRCRDAEMRARRPRRARSARRASAAADRQSRRRPAR